MSLSALLGMAATLTLDFLRGAAWKAGGASYEPLRRMLKRAGSSSTPIIVTGSTGVGKTSVVSTLNGVVDVILRDERSKDVEDELVELDERWFRFFVLPGQDLHGRKWSEIARKYRGKRVGLIDVVAAGYHEYDRDLNDAVTNSGSVRKRWLAEHRRQESERARRTIEFMLDAGVDLDWTLSVVNKADLWWPDREMVLADYCDGPYREAFELLDLDWDNDDVLPFCSYPKLFFDTVDTDGSFDTQQRAKLIAKLTARLIEYAAE